MRERGAEAPTLLDGRDWPFGSALGFILIVVTMVGTLIALRRVRHEFSGE